jgi:hypothetical protein
MVVSGAGKEAPLGVLDSVVSGAEVEASGGATEHMAVMGEEVEAGCV